MTSLSINILFLFFSVLVGLIIIRLLIIFYAKPRTIDFQESPQSSLAIVFGAGLRKDGSPTPVLRDRIVTAVELYKSGKIQKILMSGDSRSGSYSEPYSMAALAQEYGIPTEDIIFDFKGRSTFDTCFHAKELCAQEPILLVTQSFHLPRAIFICNQLGLKGIGVSADRRKYRLSSQIFWQIREIPATTAALWEVLISKSHSILEKSKTFVEEKNDK